MYIYGDILFILLYIQQRYASALENGCRCASHHSTKNIRTHIVDANRMFLQKASAADWHGAAAAPAFCSSIFISGSSEHPHLPAGRSMALLLLLFSFAIYQFYSASIVGSLLMEKPKSIKTIRDLIDSSLSIGIEDIVYNKDFFQVNARAHHAHTRINRICAQMHISIWI